MFIAKGSDRSIIHLNRSKPWERHLAKRKDRKFRKSSEE